MLRSSIYLIDFDLKVLRKFGIYPIVYNCRSRRFQHSGKPFSKNIGLFFAIIFGVCLNGVVSIFSSKSESLMVMFTIIFVGVFVTALCSVLPFLINSTCYVSLLNGLLRLSCTQSFGKLQMYLMHNSLVFFCKLYDVHKLHNPKFLVFWTPTHPL